MKEEEGMWLYFDDQKIKMGPQDAFRLQEGNYIGRKVIMGIHTEDLYVDEEHQKKFASSVIEEKVEVREMLGAESLLYFEDGEFRADCKSSIFCRGTERGDSKDCPWTMRKCISSIRIMDRQSYNYFENTIISEGDFVENFRNRKSK